MTQLVSVLLGLCEENPSFPTGQKGWGFNNLFVADPSKLLNKQSSCQICETPWHSYDTYVISEVSNLLKPASTYQWFSARLQYLQCVRNGDTAVLNKAMGIINTNNKVWNYSKKDKINHGCTHHWITHGGQGKWPPYCRQNSWREYNWNVFTRVQLAILVQIMALHWAGDKTSSEPVKVYFADAYMLSNLNEFMDNTKTHTI